MGGVIVGVFNLILYGALLLKFSDYLSIKFVTWGKSDSVVWLSLIFIGLFCLTLLPVYSPASHSGRNSENLCELYDVCKYDVTERITPRKAQN